MDRKIERYQNQSCRRRINRRR